MTPVARAAHIWERSLQRLGLQRIEQYIIGQSVMALALVCIIISMLIFLVDFVSVSRDIAAHADLNAWGSLSLTLMKSPMTILTLGPFIFLGAAIFAFVTLNRRSELIALRAAGVSAWRFVAPAAGLAILLGIVDVTTLNPVAAQLSQNFEHLRDQLLQGADAAPKAVYLRQGDGKSYTVISAERRDPKTNRLYNVKMWSFVTGPGKQSDFVKRTDAAQAELHRGYWSLTDATEAMRGDSAKHTDYIQIPSPLDPNKAFAKFVNAQALPLWALPEAIHDSEKSGFASNVYHLRFHQLLATPLMFAAMVILGATFSLRLQRLGGLVQLSVYGASLGFGVFLLNELFSALGKADLLPPVLAGWTPPLIALLCGATLLTHTEDG